MKFTRRQAIGALGGGVLAGLALEWRLPEGLGPDRIRCRPVPADVGIAGEQLQAARLVSRCQVRHLGPLGSAVPARDRATGTPSACTCRARRQYNYHVKTYGPPSKFGFKDVINEWKADKWDPAMLIQRFKSAGAKFFVTMANHHDNFDNFDSKYQPWNSVNIGPKKDIVGRGRSMPGKRGLSWE